MKSRICGSWAPVTLASLVALIIHSADSAPAMSEEKACAETNTGITLPNGFCATIFADKVGHARQIVVAPDGTVYVNTWSGVYYNNDIPPAGGFLIALKDTKGTGHADVNVRFGQTAAEGGHGGTGIVLYKNWLYAEINDRIVRYELKNGEPAPIANPTRSSAACRSTATIRCTRSPSTLKAICLSRWDRPRMRAK
jgi:hypothetical protein